MEIKGPAEALTHDQMIGLYELMVLGRTLESRLHTLHRSEQLGGTVYPGVGQEAAMVGFAAALEPGDVWGGTPRDVIMQLTRGVTIEDALRNYYGKLTGPSRGRSGNSHFGVPDRGTLMVASPPPAAYPVAVGCALAFKQQDAEQVALADCGEGATATGTWHESLTMAAALDLPIVFTVQDNRSPDAPARPAAIIRLSERAAVYGIPGVLVDAGDIVACYNAAREAVDRARAGGGPTLIEAAPPRDERERDRDPIERFESLLIDLGVLDDLRVIQLAQEVTATIQDAMDRVAKEQDPDPTEVGEGLYATRDVPVSPEPGEPDGESVTVREAIDATLAEELGRDESVFVIGADVATPAGAAPIATGLAARFGPNRVVESPFAAGGVMGAAVGAALSGRRPIVELQYTDFVYGGLDVLVNTAARYQWGVGTPVPLVVRVTGGAGLRAGPFHSLSPESLLAHHPGIKIVCPSTPTNAKGLLLAAIRDPNPVVFFEHTKLSDTVAEPIPPFDYEVPLGTARVVREGDDATVVAWSAMVPVAISVGERLAGEGISVEVVDLQTIMPLDWAAVAASIEKTSRLVIVQEDQPFASVASEIGARAASDLFWNLDAPVVSVTPPHTHVPFSGVLEDAYLPSLDDVVAAVRMVMAA